MMKVMQGQAMSGEPYRVGVVVSRFNAPITEKLEHGALEFLKKAATPEENIFLVRVPGAIEIPLAAQGLLEAGLDGVLTLGAVIRGETAHFDYVCQSAERGCSQLQLDYKKPVSFGVITTETSDQAFARAGGAKGNKGAEAAEVLLEMLNLSKDLKRLKT